MADRRPWCKRVSWWSVWRRDLWSAAIVLVSCSCRCAAIFFSLLSLSSYLALFVCLTLALFLSLPLSISLCMRVCSSFVTLQPVFKPLKCSCIWTVLLYPNDLGQKRHFTTPNLLQAISLLDWSLNTKILRQITLASRQFFFIAHVHFALYLSAIQPQNSVDSLNAGF